MPCSHGIFQTIRGVLNILIVGCGRVGALLSNMLSKDGHNITVMDVNAESFRRLPVGFPGHSIMGNGIDEESLRRGNISSSEVFISVTEEDNHNIMAAQVAKHVFNVPKVICRVYDPIRADIFNEIYMNKGLITVCPTVVGAQLLRDSIDR